MTTLLATTTTANQSNQLTSLNATTGLDKFLGMWLYGKADTTKKSYTRIINRFFDFIGTDNLHSVGLEHLQAWSESLSALKPNTLRTYQGCVKSLLTFAHKLGYLRVNAGVLLKSPKSQDASTLRHISVDQVRQMIQAEPSDRNRLILKVLFQCGLRAEELCNLRWQDLKLGAFQVTGKGSKLRTVPVATSLLQSLESLRRGDNELIFPSRQGTMTRQRIWQIVKVAAKRIGLDNPSPHWLRHGFAYDCKLNGTDDRDLQAVMGHSSYATTARYGKSINQGQLKQSSL
jgi:integrase/recombinase XerD